MLKFNEMQPADKDRMEALGYYGNGWLYDTTKPARWTTIHYDFGDGVESDLHVVAAFADYEGIWFCEDDDGNWTGMGDTPDEAIEEWCKYMEIE